ncbi:O-6-methylguanine DNA methyltransferase [Rhodoblastus acidophilus]|uniref:methylated-DNA--[protein]-cysteine S-methyltransferase n=1 Tax=Rhodoblastus acidophilus TaxID=1074 RepID=UPI00222498A8|nr:methylated-DNA--[protein]-cysteine S-methyltransferase [Rhodoblastus acidophilus]MCW2318490.1 O-6-methylguanine DNA methyltransferase [Rhodoblastus acidophilus]
MAGGTQKAKTPAGDGDEVVYGIGDTTLGPALVALSPQGVCALLFGEQEKKLMRDLRALYPDARAAAPDLLDPALAAARELAEQPWRDFPLPLDIRGTDFQRRVWMALREIAPGTTVSYAEVAQRIGAPKSLRAVAGACAANRLAIVIPCHRVLRLNGSLSGYRWGRERKLRLIELEREAVAARTCPAESGSSSLF